VHLPSTVTPINNKIAEVSVVRGEIAGRRAVAPQLYMGTSALRAHHNAQRITT
jgi:hypothetical protein